ncbi:MAG: DNA topoisomerase III [Rubrivivax sp.]|nr:DNA topoisomerase III [Rubrivivax sp.]
MSKTLIIAEKPSVAQDIVRALTPVAGKFEKHADHFESERYVVTSAVGHLVEIKAPDEYEVKRGKWSFAHLPVVPPHFDLAPIDKAKSRLNAVVKLARRKDVSHLINACDAGREGELIFRLIEQYAGGGTQGKGLAKPVQRLWLQSMTPQAIREGFEQLRSNDEMLGLADAARSRSEADWLVGINGTRAMTAFNSRDGGFFLTTVGRVQTPTLSIVVEREERIRRHVPREYWEVKAQFVAAAGSYEGKWFDPKWKKNPRAGEGAPADATPDAELRADRLWSAADAQAIADAVRGGTAIVTDESRPSTQASPLLYDLTTLQREANGRFGFSAKTTLSLAQTLYERHKLITYPRTDSRALPEDYLGTVKKTMQMLADEPLPGPMRALSAHAKKAIDEGYVKPAKRVFDNSKVSDHFAIIPTLQAPGTLGELEAKLYDLIVKRFIAIFFPSAEYLVTTRTSKVGEHHFQTNGKVLVNPGWLAVYGKEAQDEDANLVPVAEGEKVKAADAEAIALKTRPPARYTEATLLSAMEGAGKLIEDDELREAMREKGLGTPATRAAIIEGLLNEKYMLREGRELVPTAKAFQLMTLLRGLQVEDLTKPELTGDWEFKLAEMEHGRLKRESFMAEIAKMAERIVRKAKEYDRDTIPGDYMTLATPCPKCGGIVKENYRRFACTGAAGGGVEDGCGFSITKIPSGRAFELAEAEAFLRDKRIGPLEGFRSKKGFPFSADLKLVFDDEIDNWRLEFDFGDDERAGASDGEPVDFTGQKSLGPCPKCQGHVYEFGQNYVCEHSVGAHQTCDFKTGRIILQQPVSHDEVHKLLATGRTSLLEGFVSNRTRRAFKAYLRYDEKEGKVGFEFEPRGEKGGAAKGAAARGAAAQGDAGAGAPPAKKGTKAVAKAAAASPAAATATPAPAKKVAAKKVAKKAAKKVPARKAAEKKSG